MLLLSMVKIQEELQEKDVVNEYWKNASDIPRFSKQAISLRENYKTMKPPKQSLTSPYVTNKHNTQHI